MPEKDLKRLLELLAKEEEAVTKLDQKSEKKKSDLNKKYIDQIEELYRKESRSAVKDEEAEESTKADDLLNRLE